MKTVSAKQQRKTIAFAVAIMLLCAVAALAFGGGTGAAAASVEMQSAQSGVLAVSDATESDGFDFNSPEVQARCAALTASDDIEGENFTVGEYMRRVKAGEYEDSNERNVELVGKIFPIETLTNDGEYFYQGKEYMFYIKYSRNCANVVLIDYNYSFSANTDNATLRLDFLNASYYVNKTNGKVCISAYENTDEDNRIFISLPSFVGAVKNFHALNGGDTGYTKAADAGKIIDMARINYSGAYQKEKYSFGPLVEFAVLAAFDKIGDKIPIISDLKFVYELLSSTISGAHTVTHTVTANNEENIFDNDKKSAQLGNSDEQFTKQILVKPNAENLVINDYMEIIVSLEGDDVPTEAMIGAIFSLVNASGEVLVDSVTVGFHDRYYETTYSLKYGESSDAYVMPQSKQVFVFNSEAGCNHRFTAGDGLQVRVFENYDINEYKGMGAIMPSTAGIFPLAKDATYYVEVSNNGNDIVKSEIAVEIAAPEITIGDTNIDGNYAIFRLPAEKKCFYDFSCDNSDVWISVFAVNPDSATSSRLHSVAGNFRNLTYEKNTTDAMYVVVRCDSTLSAPIVLHCDTHMQIDFVSANPIDSITVVNGVCNGLPTPTQNTGYEFAGWWRESDFSGSAVTSEDLVNINEPSITLYAKEQPIIYTLRYELNGGTGVDDTAFTVEDGFDLPTPSKSGCTFVGWYDNLEFTGNAVTRLLVGTVGDKTLYARWADETYTLNSFDVNSGYVGGRDVTFSFAVPVTVEYGKHFTLPTLGCEGFAFDGWFYGDTKITDGMGASVAPYLYAQAIPLTAHWHRAYFTFKLVGENGNMWVFDVHQDPMYADFSPNDLIRELLDNEETHDEVFAHIYQEGYIFDRLTLDAEGNIRASGQTKNYVDENSEVQLYPQYIEEKYKVTFRYPNNRESYTYVYKQPINYPAVPKGYMSNGWYDEDTGERFSHSSMPDLTPDSEGNWSVELLLNCDIITYTINYVIPTKTTTGEKVNSSYITYNGKKTTYTVKDTVILPTITSNYYTLNGWYEDAAFTKSQTKIEAGNTGNRTFYAKLSIIIYTVKFDPNSGSSCKEIPATYGEVITLPTSTRDGYVGTWGSWNGTESNFGKTHTVTKSETLTASWKKVYNITYGNLKFDNLTAYVKGPSTYIEGTTVDLNNVTAIFYANRDITFVMWSSNASGEPQKVTQISGDKDVVVYARWKWTIVKEIDTKKRKSVDKKVNGI